MSPKNSLKETPLFLPTGSIRSVIALSFVVAILYCVLVGKEVPGEIYAILGVIIHAYYDKGKVNHSQTEYKDPPGKPNIE